MYGDVAKNGLNISEPKSLLKQNILNLTLHLAISQHVYVEHESQYIQQAF
jgi:hypothetical protein